MKSTRLNAEGPMYALVFDKGDEVVDQLNKLVKARRITAASFQAIGAFERAVLGYFDRNTKQYRRNAVNEQAEVVSLLGDVAVNEGEPVVHAHVVLGLPDGSARAGHLLEGRTWPTLEMVLTESPRHLRKRHDPETGLALIDLPGGNWDEWPKAA